MKISYIFNVTVTDTNLSFISQRSKLIEFGDMFLTIIKTFTAFFKQKTDFTHDIIKEDNNAILTIKTSGQLPLEKMYHLTSILEHYSCLMSNTTHQVNFHFEN